MLIGVEERRFAEAVSRLCYENPFLPGRIEAESEALGDDFISVDGSAVWSVRASVDADSPNVLAIAPRVEGLLGQLTERLRNGGEGTPEELILYRDLAVYALYYRYHEDFLKMITEDRSVSSSADRKVSFYRAFHRDWEEFLGPAGPGGDGRALDAAHLFACFYQVRRAFYYIFRFIAGGSMATARLRAAVWQSIFTHDMRRYRRSLFDRMGDISVLITGQSGTGKEIVAKAIALSGYIPFDPASERFLSLSDRRFFPLNLSALSPTLIESELFGHCRGAFTGASDDHVGWFEACGKPGTVFLDEIGDIDLGIQVKLLRVLEERTFQRLGETETRGFDGKFMAATNRDLARQIREERFRADLYYRLCSDIIVTPSLHEQICEDPAELRNLVLFLTKRVVSEEESEGLAREVCDWIEDELGLDYPWPGNVRELEQCIRNILIRRSYRPPEISHGREPLEEFLREIREGQLSADGILELYCTFVYSRVGSYQQTARVLGIDRRTVKKRINREFLDRLLADGS